MVSDVTDGSLAYFFCSWQLGLHRNDGGIPIKCMKTSFDFHLLGNAFMIANMLRSLIMSIAEMYTYVIYIFVGQKASCRASEPSLIVRYH